MKEKKQFLSRDTSICLRGVLACMVLLCHISAKVGIFGNSIAATLFSAFGYMGVSAFFFLSGYGIYEQFKERPEYVNAFPRRRILPFYCLCVFCIAVYTLRDLIFYKAFSVKTFFLSFAIGGTVVDKGWYLQVQLLLYILFYLSFRFIKKGQVLLLSGATCAFCVICAVIGLDSTWYETVVCFVLGMVVSMHKEKVVKILDDGIKGWLILAACGGLFVLTMYFGNASVLPFAARIIVKMLSAAFFACSIVIFVTKVRINNPVLRFLGVISLEIYVTQGLFLKMFKDTAHIGNDWLYALTVLAVTIAFSFAVHPVFKWINSIGRRERKPAVKGEENEHKN